MGATAVLSILLLTTTLGISRVTSDLSCDEPGQRLVADLRAALDLPAPAEDEAPGAGEQRLSEADLEAVLSALKERLHCDDLPCTVSTLYKWVHNNNDKRHTEV